MFKCIVEGSNDEGIHISRPRGGRNDNTAADFARSLPIDMPIFNEQRFPHKELDNDVSENLVIILHVKHS